MIKKYSLGTFCLNICPNMTDILSKNFDFIIFDREHGSINFETANTLNKIAKNNCLSIIRVSHLNKIEIQRTLEIGPNGIIIPQISSIQDADNAIRFSYYPPIGIRGLSPYTSPFDYYHKDSELKKKKINKELYLAFLIEGKEGIESIPSICKKYGNKISMLYFGLYDFASSLGLPANWDHKEIKKNIKSVIDTCNKFKIRVGTIARTKQEIVMLKKYGVNDICYQNDTGIFNEALKKLLI